MATNIFFEALHKGHKRAQDKEELQYDKDVNAHLLYRAFRKKHKEPLQTLHNSSFVEDVHDPKFDNNSIFVSKTKKKCLQFLSEFRFMTLTILLVVSSLMSQQTIEAFINYFVKDRILHPGKKLLWMVLISIFLIGITLLIVVFWKPVILPKEESILF